MSEAEILNLNVGVLGHVDSGKTTLAKALSTVSSTASFDKNPQSQERGITIDLGFSSFVVDMPTHLQNYPHDKLQFTLVDCPGHASLIRTVIGGAQIIDLVMLIIDVTKGMQTQTAECLIIAEITCEKMIVVLNKVDMLPEDKRSSMIEKMTKKMRLTLNSTIFKEAPIVSVAANPGGASNLESMPVGVKELVESMSLHAFLPERDVKNPFLFCVDHCFSIRGQGTVMTGTVLQGVVKLNDTVEIPSLRISKKVKSMQMFRQPTESARSGDRLGLCVTQFDPKLLERGIVCAPGYMRTISAAIISIKKIKYFKGSVKTKSRFHVSIGHETVMAKITVFSQLIDSSSSDSEDKSSAEKKFNFNIEYKYQAELLSLESEQAEACKQFALLEFEKPLLVVPHCFVIGSKLDIDIHANTCRLAFCGSLEEGFEDRNYVSSMLPKLKVYKDKFKKGYIERAVNEHDVIVNNLFKKETNIQLFTGLKVKLSTGEEGIIDGSFGQSGKTKIQVCSGMKETTIALLKGPKKKGVKLGDEKQKAESVQILLSFKRYVFDPQKKIIQL